MSIYKEEPADPHHPLPPQQGPIPQQLQHPRPNVSHPQSHPDSPHQAQHTGPFPSPHSSGHGVPLQHQSPYPQPVPASNGHTAPELYYSPSPYGAPIAGQYSSAEAPDLMAAAQMQRPYQQPVYHTPQSNSPASVASSQGHDQHGRMYAQPPAQMQQGMYGYQYPPLNQVPPSAYPQHPGQQQQQQQHQMMTSQPLLPHQHGQPPMPHQSPAQPAGTTNSPRPQTKLEPGMPRPLDPASLQRSPTGPMNSNHNTPTGPSQNGNGMHPGQPGGPGVNPNAAPGPIPATTPLVVRQDNNGVQWIAFEYSRDRVKMEYTIRCDVESVNTDGLPHDFRTDNCVYPRACCPKDQYKGNRLQYENECNTVGWALAELNPCLRGKRGLIQRAVDSWRNSNQDARLRSRRVRRMAKMNTRKHTSSHPPNHLAGPRDVGGPPPNANPMAAPGQRPPPTNISMAGAAQMHHHHAHPDGSTPGGTEDVSVNGDYDPNHQPLTSKPSPGAIRPSNAFYPSFPTAPNPSGPSMTPQLHGGIDTALPNHAVSASTSVPAKTESPSPEKKSSSLFADLPESKRRKFILVEDTERNSRVRVRVALEGVDIAEIPDSYRKGNSVYPRSWFPTQMQLSPSSRGSRGRFVEDRVQQGSAGAEEEEEDEDEEERNVGSVMIRVPMLEGREGELAVPGLGRKWREREEKLNDLGYRMSWSQSRTFAGRVVFLQRSLDAYRNKMKSTLVAGGQDVSTVAPHFETRIGKQMWLKRGKKKASTRRAATP